MKSLKNDVKAWLLLCSGLGTILFLMGGPRSTLSSLKALVYTVWAGKKANLVWSIGKPY